jgi:hypothetical protein
MDNHYITRFISATNVFETVPYFLQWVQERKTENIKYLHLFVSHHSVPYPSIQWLYSLNWALASTFDVS